MDMRSLIHQGSSPRGDERPAADAAAPSASAGYAASTGVSRPMAMPMAASGFALRQAPTIFHRPQQEQQQQQQTAAPTLAPLRFIIPSSMSGGFAHGASVSSTTAMTSETRAAPYQVREPEHEPQPPQNPILAFDESFRRDQQQQQQQRLQPAATNAAFPQPAMAPGAMVDSKDSVKQALKIKKPTPKRARQPKNSSRSTKSKARPGLRKGKWTEEESRYAAQLTNYFKEGLLPLERGTMLRLYLSQKLNCEPMRITKKFTGGECIGKQVFRPCSPTPESRVRLMQAQLELVALEAAFIKRVKENREEVPVATDEFDASSMSVSSPGSSASKPRPVLLKPRGSVSTEDDNSFGVSNRPLYPAPASGSVYGSNMQAGRQDARAGSVKTEKGDVDDASAVGLLLDFFYKANRSEESPLQAEAANTMGQLPQQQAKKMPVASTSSSPAGSTAARGERDEAIASPTKRMRALSVSKYPNDATTTKRSRVGSFTVCA